MATYGTTSGAIGYMANKAIQNREIDACYSVRMTDTWMPMFDLSTPQKVEKFTKKTENEIQDVIQRIDKREKNKKMSLRTMAFITKLFAQPIYNKKARLTTHFHVENSCIGCGLCAKNCPVQAIELQNKKPVWTKEKCAMCLGCLHHCPKFSIQYGKHTKKHGQYRNPNVTL